MNACNNQKGYVLLIVLFLIVFIMTITAVFMRGSIGTAKQEEITDRNNLAVVAAEMGVEYYTTKFSNTYYEKSEEVLGRNKQIYLDKIKKNPNLNKSNEILIAQSKIREEIILILRGVSLDPPSFTSIGETNKQISFYLKPEKLQICRSAKCNQPRVIILEGEVKGIYAESSKDMEFTLTFQIPDLFKKDPNSNGEPESTPPGKNEGENTKWPCNKSNKNNCVATIDNYLDVGKVEMKKGKLKFNDSLDVSSLEIKGGNDAHITVGQNLSVKTDLIIQNHACISVQGNLTVGQKVKFQSNAKMYIYVNGNAYLQSLDGLQNIYVSGNVYLKGTKQPINKYKPVPIGAKCNLPESGGNDNESPEQNNWEWKEPVIEVFYK